MIEKRGGYKLCVWFYACLLSISLHAQVGKMFPLLKGVTLEEVPVSIPFNNGKGTIVAIAFDRDAEGALKKWLNPIYNMFIVKKKEGSNFDMAELYDVNFCFVPMISGFKKIANDFKAGTDKEFWPYIVDTEKTDIKKLEAALGIVDIKIPYFYVLDKSGKITQTVNGDFNDEKMDLLEDAVE